MSATKHTQGPWSIYDSADEYGIKVKGQDPVIGGAHVAVVLGLPNARLIAAAPRLLAVARAALLFHSAGPWHEHAKEWKELTGSDEATTKVLCDFARAAIAETEGRP